MLLDLRSLLEAGAEEFVGSVSETAPASTEAATATVRAAQAPTIPRLLVYGAAPPGARRRARPEPSITSPVIKRTPPRRPEPEPELPAPLVASVSQSAPPATQTAAVILRLTVTAADAGPRPLASARALLTLRGVVAGIAPGGVERARTSLILRGRVAGAGQPSRSALVARRTWRDDPLELALLGIGDDDLLTVLLDEEDLALAS